MFHLAERDDYFATHERTGLGLAFVGHFLRWSVLVWRAWELPGKLDDVRNADDSFARSAALFDKDLQRFAVVNPQITRGYEPSRIIFGFESVVSRANSAG
jgi:hypothetical protein